MENALEINGLCKHYDGFALQDVSFTLPRGVVMGFIGENGAGKTTTIKAVLNLIRRDAGAIKVLGLDNIAQERAVKERIGVVLEDGCFLNTLTARHVDVLMGKAYQSWQSEQFFRFMERFGIDRNKKIKDYSKGMRMKLSIATALSHHPRLLLLDEPTSGLDPVVRNELLDEFLDFIQDEGRAILLSSHITSDLEKAADYVTYLHRGRVAVQGAKDELLESYGRLACARSDLQGVDPALLVGARTGQFGCEALVRDRRAFRRQYPALTVDPVTLEDIMVFTVRGDEA